MDGEYNFEMANPRPLIFLGVCTLYRGFISYYLFMGNNVCNYIICNMSLCTKLYKFWHIVVFWISYKLYTPARRGGGEIFYVQKIQEIGTNIALKMAPPPWANLATFIVTYVQLSKMKERVGEGKISVIQIIYLPSNIYCLVLFFHGDLNFHPNLLAHKIRPFTNTFTIWHIK